MDESTYGWRRWRPQLEPLGDRFLLSAAALSLSSLNLEGLPGQTAAAFLIRASSTAVEVSVPRTAGGDQAAAAVSHATDGPQGDSSVLVPSNNRLFGFNDKNATFLSDPKQSSTQTASLEEPKAISDQSATGPKQAGPNLPRSTGIPGGISEELPTRSSQVANIQQADPDDDDIKGKEVADQDYFQSKSPYADTEQDKQQNSRNDRENERIILITKVMPVALASSPVILENMANGEPGPNTATTFPVQPGHVLTAASAPLLSLPGPPAVVSKLTNSGSDSVPLNIQNTPEAVADDATYSNGSPSVETTNSLLANAPAIQSVVRDFLKFTKVGGEPIVGIVSVDLEAVNQNLDAFFSKLANLAEPLKADIWTGRATAFLVAAALSGEVARRRRQSRPPYNSGEAASLPQVPWLPEDK